MKKINLFFLVLGLCFSIQTMKATNPISLESYEELANKKEHKTSIFKKAKKWFRNAADKVKISKLAKASVILGIISLSGLLLLVLGFYFTGLALIIGVIALLADILAIIVLVKTGKEKSEYRNSRTAAVWGLITGLLAGLIPLASLIIVIIALFLYA